MSKLRYGLQLCTEEVRLTENQTKSYDMEATQITQNKLLRFLDKSRLNDKRNVKEMLKKFDLLSVNQVTAQIKLTDMWKSENDPEYPIKIKKHPETMNEDARTVRQGTRREMEERGRTNHQKRVL